MKIELPFGAGGPIKPPRAEDCEPGQEQQVALHWDTVRSGCGDAVRLDWASPRTM